MSRVSPAIAVGSAVTGERVVAVPERRKRTTGAPARIAVDNGPEFIVNAHDAWAAQHGVQLAFSRPGKPTDNALAERFNGRFRDEGLNQHGFAQHPEARQTIEAWRIEDHPERPQRALGQATPAAWMTAQGPLVDAAG